MKVRFKLLFSICILSFFASCVDIKLDFCEDPVTEDLTGIVIDPATSLPVVGAKVTYSNTSDPIHASDKSTTTDEEGKFSVTESGCKHGDWYDLLYFQSASHPEYDEHIRVPDTNNKIVMYNTRDLNIILKRSGPDTIKNETYHFEYCVPEGMDCHVSGKRETIDASNLETITMQVFHLADSLKIHIRINPWSTSDWTVNTINIAGRDEVIIEY